jgi:hypothetical protein
MPSTMARVPLGPQSSSGSVRPIVQGVRMRSGKPMRQERDPEFSRCQTRDPFLLCRCGGPTNDARVGVEQISMVIHHNRDPERMQGCTLTR